MDIFNKELHKIAICGKKRVGKNTLSTILANLISIKYHSEATAKIMAFADPIKEMILQMFPKANKNCLFGSSELREEIIPDAIDQNGNPLTYRQALIDIGTLGRKYNPNMWVNVFHNRIQTMNDNYFFPIKLIICSDLRFPEEFEFLKKHNFCLVKLRRKDTLLSDNPTETAQDGISLDLFDIVVDNDKSIDDLTIEAKKIIELSSTK